jgi:tRNA (guanine37-N1)-methyltransferase
MIRFSVITLFPEMIEGIFSQGVISQGREQKLLQIDCVNPRKFTEDVHKTVDDRPFGGGDGMLMMTEPLSQSVESIHGAQSHVVYLSPQGRRFDDSLARELSQKQHVILVCGRYGGVDQRFINQHVDEEISIGDYVLSGGELASAVVIEATARMIPGVLGHKDSSLHDSFSQGTLEEPSFTRPRVWEVNGQKQEVPSILLSGNHQKIKEWRNGVSELVTLFKRPDLIASRGMTQKQFENLEKFWQGLSVEDKAVLGLEGFQFPKRGVET